MYNELYIVYNDQVYNVIVLVYTELYTVYNDQM